MLAAEQPPASEGYHATCLNADLWADVASVHEAAASPAPGLKHQQVSTAVLSDNEQLVMLQLFHVCKPDRCQHAAAPAQASMG